MRDMSSRLSTSRVSRSASASMVTRNSRRCAWSHSTSGSSRLEADALIAASGVRRSWETELSRAVRSRSVSTSASPRRRSSSRWPCSTASAAWLAKVASTRRSSSPKPSEPGSPATTTIAPTRVSPARIGMVSARPGSRSPSAGPRTPTERPAVAPARRSSRWSGRRPSLAARRVPPSRSARTMAQPARPNRVRTVRATLFKVSSRLPWATRLVDSSNSVRVSRSRRSACVRRRSSAPTSRLTTSASTR
jgi:hypothetical protein